MAPSTEHGSSLEPALIKFLRARGPLDGATIAAELKLSQPTFSRLVRTASPRVAAFGARKNRRYVARREIDRVEAAIPIHEITAEGRPRLLGFLSPAATDGFVFTPSDKPGSASEPIASYFPATPHFLEDLLPQGYLGRHLSILHPDLDLPAQPKDWSTNTALRYLTRHAHDSIGNLILGTGSYEGWLRSLIRPPPTVDTASRARVYAERAEVALDTVGGSSVGGDQPKFLQVVSDEKKKAGTRAVIVKFSPRSGSDAAERVADLLHCECIALKILSAHGFDAARSEIVKGEERTFLEVERFDRVWLDSNRDGGAVFGRTGLVSLAALDHHFVGSTGEWPVVSSELEKMRLVPAGTARETLRRFLFGKLIANTDMHNGNLSFRCQGLAALPTLAPIYDMGPMHYALRGGEATWPVWAPLQPSRGEADALPQVLPAALAFWEEVVRDPAISERFRRTAKDNLAQVAKLERVTRFLVP